ncbi:MAG: LLM class F420-dependent oxidoreductase [Acidimicrobiales bacterium]
MEFGLLFANTMGFATAEGSTELAQAAEAAGFDSLWTVEHVLWPADYESEYPYDPSGRMAGSHSSVIPDPLVWLTWVAAHTKTIKLATGILILPQRNPAVLAKEVATLDQLSGGRAMLGIGVGWLEEEFSALGVPFARRGKRTDEYVAAMRALWSGEHVDFNGEFVNWSRVNSNPKPVNGSVPIVVGGHSRKAAERAGYLGDGFVPGNGDIPELIDVMKQTAADAGRNPDDIEVTAPHPGIFGADPAAAVEEAASFGVDRLIVPSYFLAKGDVAETCRSWAEKFGTNTSPATSSDRVGS